MYKIKIQSLSSIFGLGVIDGLRSLFCLPFSRLRVRDSEDFLEQI